MLFLTVQPRQLQNHKHKTEKCADNLKCNMNVIRMSRSYDGCSVGFFFSQFAEENVLFLCKNSILSRAHMKSDIWHGRSQTMEERRERKTSVVLRFIYNVYYTCALFAEKSNYITFRSLKYYYTGPERRMCANKFWQ